MAKEDILMAKMTELGKSSWENGKWLKKGQAQPSIGRPRVYLWTRRAPNWVRYRPAGRSGGTTTKTAAVAGITLTTTCARRSGKTRAPSKVQFHFCFRVCFVI